MNSPHPTPADRQSDRSKMRTRSKNRRGARSRSRTVGRAFQVENLESRQLLATLTAGAGGDFPTIQAAINNARSGDVIQLFVGDYNESLDLSLMGSAVGGSTGDLTIRGEDDGDAQIETTLSAVGGPAASNSSQYNGNVTFERLNVESNVESNDLDIAFLLDNFQGDFTLNNVSVIEAYDGGVVVQNSSGTFSFEDSKIDDIGRREFVEDEVVVITEIIPVRDAITFTGNDDITARFVNTEVGHILSKPTGANPVLNNSVDVTNSGNSNFVFYADNATFSGSPSQADSTSKGLNFVNEGSAFLSIILSNTSINNLNSSAIDLLASGSSRVQATMIDSHILDVDGTAAVDLNSANTSDVNFSIINTTLTDHSAVGIHLEASDTSTLRSNINRLLLNAPATATTANHGIVVTSNASANADVHVNLDDNDFVDVSGDGIHVNANGSTTFNVNVNDSLFSNVNSVGGEGATVLTSTSAAATLNVYVTNNIVSDTPLESFVLRQTNNSAFNLVGTGSDPKTSLLASQNDTKEDDADSVASITAEGTINIVDGSAFENDIPLLIGNLVFNDENNNGLLDFGSTEDEGNGNIPLRITGTDVHGTSVDQDTTTGNFGGYAFGGLFPGTYNVTFTPPTGFNATTFKAGNDDTRDSDFLPGSNRATVTLAAGETNFDIDAGLTDSPVHIWQNPLDPNDVNADTIVSPIDALLVINRLNAHGTGPLPTTGETPPPFYDVNGDDLVAPIDALRVINQLNADAAANSEGEAEAIIVLAAQDAASEENAPRSGTNSEREEGSPSSNSDDLLLAETAESNPTAGSSAADVLFATGDLDDIVTELAVGIGTDV